MQFVAVATPVLCLLVPKRKKTVHQHSYKHFRNRDNLQNGALVDRFSCHRLDGGVRKQLFLFRSNSITKINVVKFHFSKQTIC